MARGRLQHIISKKKTAAALHKVPRQDDGISISVARLARQAGLSVLSGGVLRRGHGSSFFFLQRIDPAFIESKPWLLIGGVLRRVMQEKGGRRRRRRRATAGDPLASRWSHGDKEFPQQKYP
jgi:hypothetical protein